MLMESADSYGVLQGSRSEKHFYHNTVMESPKITDETFEYDLTEEFRECEESGCNVVDFLSRKIQEVRDEVSGLGYVMINCIENE